MPCRFRSSLSVAALSSRHRVPWFWWIPGSRTRFIFARFDGWFAGVERRALKLGDYSVSGLEDVRLMAEHPHRQVVITSALSQVKSPYSNSRTDPNRIMQILIAALAGLQVPFVCSETHELGEELVGSYLKQVHLLPLVEDEGLRSLSD
jgi:hypothetical protein